MNTTTLLTTNNTRSTLSNGFRHETRRISSDSILFLLSGLSRLNSQGWRLTTQHPEDRVGPVFYLVAPYQRKLPNCGITSQQEIQMVTAKSELVGASN